MDSLYRWFFFKGKAQGRLNLKGPIDPYGVSAASSPFCRTWLTKSRATHFKICPVEIPKFSAVDNICSINAYVRHHSFIYSPPIPEMHLTLRM